MACAPSTCEHLLRLPCPHIHAHNCHVDSRNHPAAPRSSCRLWWRASQPSSRRSATPSLPCASPLAAGERGRAPFAYSLAGPTCLGTACNYSPASAPARSHFEQPPTAGSAFDNLLQERQSGRAASPSVASAPSITFSHVTHIFTTCTQCLQLHSFLLRRARRLLLRLHAHPGIRAGQCCGEQGAGAASTMGSSNVSRGRGSAYTPLTGAARSACDAAVSRGQRSEHSGWVQLASTLEILGYTTQAPHSHGNAPDSQTRHYNNSVTGRPLLCAVPGPADRQGLRVLRVWRQG